MFLYTCVVSNRQNNFTSVRKYLFCGSIWIFDIFYNRKNDQLNKNVQYIVIFHLITLSPHDAFFPPLSIAQHYSISHIRKLKANFQFHMYICFCNLR